MDLYSVKMRGSKAEEHISGAEKIVKEKEISKVVESFVNRAFIHKKGKSDFINIKIEKIDEKEIKYIDKIKVTSVKSANKKEAKEVMITILKKLDIDEERAIKIVEELYKIKNMRGAKILDVENLKRVDTGGKRGVRVTFMDEKEKVDLSESKNHFLEAIILASKVINYKNIIGELCISDDLDYTTGYIATKKFGYIRIENIKKLGEDFGGRIFLYRGKKEEVHEAIQYLEKQKVLVIDKSENERILSMDAFREERN